MSSNAVATQTVTENVKTRTEARAAVAALKADGHPEAKFVKNPNGGWDVTHTAPVATAKKTPKARKATKVTKPAAPAEKPEEGDAPKNTHFVLRAGREYVSRIIPEWTWVDTNIAKARVFKTAQAANDWAVKNNVTEVDEVSVRIVPVTDGKPSRATRALVLPQD